MGKPDFRWKIRKHIDSNQELNRQVLKIRESWLEVEKILKDKKKKEKN